MISAPNTSTWICETVALEKGSPSKPATQGREISRKIGSNRMKAAPRKLPRIEPTPPMMIMNRMRNDISSEKPSGSTEPR